jgi:hypothetical protein
MEDRGWRIEDRGWRTGVKSKKTNNKLITGKHESTV